MDSSRASGLFRQNLRSRRSLSGLQRGHHSSLERHCQRTHRPRRLRHILRLNTLVGTPPRGAIAGGDAAPRMSLVSRKGEPRKRILNQVLCVLCRRSLAHNRGCPGESAGSSGALVNVSLRSNLRREAPRAGHCPFGDDDPDIMLVVVGVTHPGNDGRDHASSTNESARDLST